MTVTSARQCTLVVGAGIGGLAAAVALAARGAQVEIIERAAAPGGKMREVPAGQARVDGGPTVFTMRWVFDELLDAAGTSLDDRLTLKPTETIARHAWEDGSRLDLFADAARSAEAIGELSGPAEGRRYLGFCNEAEAIYRALEAPFIRGHRTGVAGLIGRAGIAGIGGLMRINPYATLWDALGKRFADPRLRQLFGRYSTYAGSSPFLAPATLMLISHVERVGVWLVEGGMHRLARMLAELAQELGVRMRYGAEVAEVLVERGRAAGVRLATGEAIPAGAVVFNGDASALPQGLLGQAARRAVPDLGRSARSLSAMTWCLDAPTEGFPLVRHTVFFCRDYPAEFQDIFVRGRLPQGPTVYVCAQDRDDRGERLGDQPERLLLLVNAPPNGDSHPYSEDEIEQCAERTFSLLRRCGLQVRADPARTTVTTPAGFAELFPGTGGALYGPSAHGWRASFTRPGARTAIPGLYLAGGSTHPGAGVPMAALSGRLAASCVLRDLASTSAPRAAAISGGTSTV